MQCTSVHLFIDREIPRLPLTLALFPRQINRRFPPFSPPVRHPKHSHTFGSANLLTFSSRIILLSPPKIHC